MRTEKCVMCGKTYVINFDSGKKPTKLSIIMCSKCIGEYDRSKCNESRQSGFYVLCEPCDNCVNRFKCFTQVETIIS